MTEPTGSDLPPGDRGSFDGVLRAVRDRTLRLTCSIGRIDYLTAWLEACELERQLERAARVAAAIPDARERAAAMRRLDDVRAVSASMLALAPAPSPLAIRQARSTDRYADRSAWQREEQQWIAARAADNAAQLLASARCSASPDRDGR
jgi:hypothetical protein